MKYTGKEEREIAKFGVYKPGDVVNFNESLLQTGLFTVEKKKNEEGDK